jgi:hypothetical protein
MNDHLVRRAARWLAPLALAIVALVAPAQVASADDTPVAWSVSPADANGAVDGRSRLELQLDPGATGTDHVQIANASTTDQTFEVYGADAVNTADGGYDLLAAGVASVDAGSWVSVDTSTVTVPALSTAMVAVTVAVPAGAAAGDHPAGVVVSRAKPADGQGVLVDTRVAVRLSVRVSGQLAPALDVRDVQVSWNGSAVPFAPADATVLYTLANTGNVTVIGSPRLRVSGPLGLGAVVVEPEATREVLPGRSFTVRSVVTGVPAAILDTAVVDVTMAAAPGPQTTIPLVSATRRASFAAVPWTGLVVLAMLAGLGTGLVRRRRRRRAEGAAMWAELVEHAKQGELPADRTSGVGRADAGVVGVLLAVGLAIGSVLGLVLAVAPAVAADPLPSGAATVQLSVPAAPSSVAPVSTSVTSTSGSMTTRTTVGSGTSPARSVVPADPVQAQVLAEDSTTGTATPSPGPSAAVLAADTNWRAPSGFTPAQWGLAAASGLVLIGGAGLGVRALVLARAGRATP